MIRAAFAVLFLLPGMAAAQESDPEAIARQAAAQLAQAAEALVDAETRADRVAALTRTVHAYEAGLATLRDGLRSAALREKSIRAEFDAESERLSRLLGVLQSMQTSPETLLLLHPSGPVGTARAGMLISEVAPAVEAEVAALRTRLDEVIVLRSLQESAIDTLSQGLDGIQAARIALTRAISERDTLPGRVSADDEAMRALVNSADTLEGFASSLTSLSGFEGDGPAGLAFESAKGALPYPVDGRLLRKSGEADAAGIRRPGILVATRPRALVTAPWSSTIRYVGPLLDYGNVIILEPASGYLLILAGLGDVYGALGDVVQSGAPVGLMGGQTRDSQEILTELAEGSGQNRTETLYMELRQGDSPVDPQSWFTSATK